MGVEVERGEQEERGYWVFDGGEIEWMSMRGIVGRRDEGVWSVRLSTGLLGKVDCPSGNRGPIDENEVMVVVGEEGLWRVIELGFLCCPSCRPESEEKVGKVLQKAVFEVYGVELEQFLDKRKFGFDPRRIDWEELVGVTGVVPERLYLPKGLRQEEVDEVLETFMRISEVVPELGWYNREVEGRFERYG